jgi:hypothetical protein
VLQFAGTGCQLVDFGLSCGIEDDNNNNHQPYNLLQRGGSQTTAVGPRVRDLLCCDDEVLVTWTVANDFEMLLGMLGHFNNPLIGPPTPFQGMEQLFVTPSEQQSNWY